jgi:hypothetical protein
VQAPTQPQGPVALPTLPPMPQNACTQVEFQARAAAMALGVSQVPQDQQLFVAARGQSVWPANSGGSSETRVAGSATSQVKLPRPLPWPAAVATDSSQRTALPQPFDVPFNLAVPIGRAAWPLPPFSVPSSTAWTSIGAAVAVPDVMLLRAPRRARSRYPVRRPRDMANFVRNFLGKPRSRSSPLAPVSMPLVNRGRSAAKRARGRRGAGVTHGALTPPEKTEDVLNELEAAELLLGLRASSHHMEGAATVLSHAHSFAAGSLHDGHQTPLPVASRLLCSVAISIHAIPSPDGS